MDEESEAAPESLPLILPVVLGPVDREVPDAPDGAWYGEARPTRVFADDDVWATLAEESVDRSPQIVAKGGQPFHRTQGVIDVHEKRQGSNGSWPSLTGIVPHSL